jgi:uncharacterized UBP type Zn finger protein
MCGPCGSKQPSIKGYRFRSFPYLLALQLKRFDMNWNTMSRIKLDNLISFPSRLDLSSYLAHGLYSLHPLMSICNTDNGMINFNRGGWWH